MKKLVLVGNPLSTNHIYRFHGHKMYMVKEGKELKESYGWQAKSQWEGPPLEGEVNVMIELFFVGNRRRDIDNWHKILLDSLTGIAWEDDCQIATMYVKKNRDNEYPRIEITIFK